MKLSKEDIANIYPCTPMQEGMFSSWQINPDSASYSVQTNFVVKGTIDKAVFEESFNHLIEKHDVLKTLFRQISGHSSLQIVLKKANCQFKYYDLETNPELEELTLAEEDKNQSFDLSNQTPFRLLLIRSSEEVHTIVWTHHHILMEGWCFFMLMKDFLNIYYSTSRGEEIIEVTRPGFSRYITWLKEQDKAASRTYWNEYLKGYKDEKRRFPVNKGKLNTSYAFGIQEVGVLDAEYTKIEEICRKWGCTLNQLVGILWVTLLFQYNNCRDIVYGMVMSVRPSEVPDIEKMIGNFLNTIPIRVSASEDSRVKDLVAKLKEDFANSYEHRYYPLADIHESRGFQVVNHILTFENYPDLENSREMERLGWKVEELPTYEPSDYDINLVVQMDPGLALRIDYNKNVYTDRTVSDLLRSFSGIVSRFVTNPSIKVSDLVEKQVGKTKEKQFWESTLSGGDLQVPALVGTGPKGGAGLIEKNLTPETNVALMRISSGSKERVQVLLYSALLATLRKYTGHSDFLVASPIFAQSQNNGEFINKIICLRTPFTGDDTFQELAGKAGQSIQEAIRHQNYPYEHISRFLSPTDDTVRDLAKFFSVVMSIEGLHLEGALDQLSPQLHFYFKENEEGLYLTLLYDTENLGSEYVNGIARDYVAMADNLLKKASAPLKETGLLSQALTRASYGQKQEYDYNRIDHWLKASLEEYSDRCALRMGDSSITYAELNDKSLQVAGFLHARGLDEGAMVGLCVKRSIDAIIALLGIVRAGGAFVPLDSGIPEHRLQYIVDQTAASFLIVDQAFDIKGTEQLSIQQLRDAPAYVNANFALQGDAHSLCYTLFTSGTTGNSKGCMISNLSLVNYVNWVHSTYLAHLEGVPSFGWYTTLGFDFTLTSIFGALTSGGQIRIFDEDQNIGSVLLDLFSTDINIVKLTPSHISILSHLGLSKTKVEVAICGGEELTINNINTLSGLSPGMKIFNEYGPTEATVGCIVSEVDHGLSLMNIGQPINNSAACIIDTDGHIQPEGVVGEIALAGDNVMQGYLKGLGNERLFLLSSVHSTERFYKTGDLGYLKNGKFYCLGRVDEEFKLRGYRIHPSEVTEALNKFDGVSSSFVNKVSENTGDLMVGYLVCADQVDVNEVKAFVSQYLPEYMVPSHIFIIDELPLKPSGKIDVQRLPSYESWKRSGVNYTAPSNLVERKLVEIWQEVMGKEQIGVFDNFFMIGGHSLHATQIVTRIKRDLTSAVDFRALYSYPSIDRLSVHVGKLLENEPAATASGHQGVTSTEKSPYYPLSHAQRRLWIIEQLDSSKKGYLTAGLYEIQGPLDMESIRYSFESLVARHEILRTRFFKGEGAARQEVLNLEESGFQLLEESYTTDENTLKRLETLLHSPIDLSSGSAMKVVLSQADDTRFYLGLSFHHIVCDGWSMNVILSDIQAFYKAHQAGQHPLLSSMQVQYRDFAIWEESYLEKEGDRLSAFWQAHLKGVEEALEIPFDYPRPSKRTYAGGFVEQAIELSPLKGFSIEQGIGLYSLLMSSIKVVLHSLTGSNQITIGTAVTGRDRIELENQVGLYVNTLPFHTQLDTAQGLGKFIKQEHNRLLDMLEYQNYPFDKIMEDLDYQTVSNRNPLFDVGFTWHADTFELMSFSDDLKLREIPLAMGTAKADLWFHASIEKDSLKLMIEYDKDLFQEESVELILYRLSCLLKDLRQVINSAIADINLEYKREKPSVSKIEFDF